MLAADEMGELFKRVQEEASALLWSQGVQLTRGQNQFILLSKSSEEWIVQLRIAGQMASPKITLWPKQNDWDCDCGSLESPCSHIAACMIVAKKGELIESAESSQGKDGALLAHLEYHFFKDGPALRLDRYFVFESTKKVFKTPLMSYISGIKAGRLKAPDVLALKADFNVEEALRGYTGLALDRKRLESLFGAFEAEQKIFLNDKPVQISSARIIQQFECIDEADGYRLRRVPNALYSEIFNHGVVLMGDTLKLINATFLSEEEKSWFAKGGSFWPKEQEADLAGKIIPQLKKKIALQINSLKLPQALDLKPRIDLLLEKDKNLAGVPCLSVVANIVYGEPPLLQLNYQTLQLNPVQKSYSKQVPAVTRDQSQERYLMQKLAQELNLQPSRRVEFVGEQALEFVRKVEGWEHRGNGFEAFSPTLRHLEPNIDWGQLGTDFQVSFAVAKATPMDSHAEFGKVFEAWQQGINHVQLVDGSWATLPRDWMNQFGKRIQSFLDLKGKQEAVAPQLKPELARLCEDMGAELPASLKSLSKALNEFNGIPDAPLPLGLKANLRPYQKLGFNWLKFLKTSSLGALLADDMGLGKTLQTICAIEGKTLIVCPTSVVFNWEQELKRFRPNLKVNLYYGPQRKLEKDDEVVLTSYGHLRMDQELLSGLSWDMLVLDEAHNIKNPDSQVSRAAFQLKGNFKVTLTGTPIENRLDDLWSQFQFLNPGLLGTRDQFKDSYVRPIEAGDGIVSKTLKQKVKPFILRRLKKDVLKDLPPKIETVLHCELSTEERSLYRGLLASSKSEVMEQLDSSGGVMKALELILRLRQACCHADLIPGQKIGHSSKLQLLMETLDESLAEGHKSLIFSQWTGYLDFIQAELINRKINFSRIDGSTQNRGEIVNAFQSSEGPPVMLISLKAGGVGLNLTAADHVFIMDPWWNPAVEDQASDRAHRMGQENPVMVHRLVALESIEEKILLLQEKKKDLARSVLDDGQAALGLSKDDILMLLN